MDQGWIKLHRRSLNNPLFRDITAWHIFEFCLLKADRNGVFTVGRHQLEDWTGIKGTTAYKALKRLEKAKMVTVSVTFGKYGFSEILILNWEKYQLQKNDSNSFSDEKVTNECPISNTLQEYRIKNKEYITPPPYSASGQKWLDLWKEVFGYEITRYVRHSLESVSIMVKKHGTDSVKEMLLVARHALSNKYAPRPLRSIKNYETILWRWDDLQAYRVSVYLQQQTNKIKEV